MSLPIIQSLWVGSRLSVMEQLSIRSHLDQGHPFHLYTYEHVENVPAGTVVRQADEILPPSEVFKYRAKGYGQGSFAAGSNCFRYKLLLERGGWWTDLDSVCLRPVDFAEEHILANTRGPDGRLHVCNGVIRAPAGSPLMEYCWQRCQQVDRARLVWGQIGPKLLGEAVNAVPVAARILPPDAFVPYSHFEVWQLIGARRLPMGSYAIHLFNSKWRYWGLDPDARYDPHCIYEQLKQRYGVSSPSDAARGPSLRSLTQLRWKQFQVGLRKVKRLLRAA